MAGRLHAQPVLIQSITGPSDPVPNTTNSPYYEELSGIWGNTSNKSKAPSSPPFSATGSRQTTNINGPPAFSFIATNALVLQPGINYVVQITTPTSSSQPPPADLVVAVSASGVTNSTLVSTTAAFALSGADKWTTLGEVVCETPNPTFTFTYLSGGVTNVPTRRFYSQCIRFVPQNQTNGLRTWTGGAGGADPMWNNPTNWGGIAPRFDGDDIVFNGSAGLISVADGSFSVDSLKFLPGAGSFSLGSTTHNTFAGPISIATTNGIANYSTNDQVIYTPISQGDVPLVVDTGTKTLSISNTIAGTGGYSVHGNGTLYLRVPSNGLNPITGPILVNTGATLRLARHSAAGATAPNAGDVTLDGGTLRNDDISSMAAFLAANRNIVVGLGGGTLDLPGSSQNLVYDGVITNNNETGPLFKTGSGRLVLGGETANSYLAETIVSAGRLILSKSTSNAIPSHLNVAGAIVQLTASDQIGDAATVTVAGGILGLQGFISDTVSEVVLNGGSITGAVATLTASHFDVRSGTNTTMLSGDADLVKTTDGVVLLSCENSYTGTTTVNGGKLILNGSIGPGQVTIAGGTLAGIGNITGPVVVQNGGKLSPGLSVGQLTFIAGLTLESGSVTSMELDRLAGTNDLIAGLASVNYGGTLTLTNLAGDLTTNDVFKLFDFAEYGGAFQDYNLPALVPPLVWVTSHLTIDGTIRIVDSSQPPPQPQMTNVVLDATNFIISGFGGTMGGSYRVLSSADIAEPLTNWSIIATGQFDSEGLFNWTNPVSPEVSRQFFILQLP